jgi:hypothetical protein
MWRHHQLLNKQNIQQSNLETNHHILIEKTNSKFDVCGSSTTFNQTFKCEQNKKKLKTYHPITMDGNPTLIVDCHYFLYKI